MSIDGRYQQQLLAAFCRRLLSEPGLVASLSFNLIILVLASLRFGTLGALVCSACKTGNHMDRIQGFLQGVLEETDLP